MGGWVGRGRVGRQTDDRMSRWMGGWVGGSVDGWIQVHSLRRMCFLGVLIDVLIA